MSERREIRSFDYVNHAYENVRDVLAADPAGVFQAATRAAASRAQSVAAELHVNVAGLEVGAEIALAIGDIEEVGRRGHVVGHQDSRAVGGRPAAGSVPAHER